MDNSESTKSGACKDCSVSLPVRESGRGRQRERCEACARTRRNEQQARYRALGRRREDDRRYREKNRERLNARSRERYQEHREERLAYYKRYHEENAEARRQYSREHGAERRRGWLARNPEKKQAYENNRRARLASLEGTHTGDELLQMYDDQQGLCAYCETPMFGCWSVDHMMPVSKGGRNDWTNLAVVCKWCNCRKQAKTAEQYIETFRH